MAQKKSAPTSKTKKATAGKSAPAKAPASKSAHGKHAKHDAKRAEAEPPPALPKARKLGVRAPVSAPPSAPPNPSKAAKIPPAPEKPAAPAKKPAKHKPSGPPTADELRAMPTDDVWVHYRKAAGEHPRDEARLEVLRNVLMEMHYPLVKHIAERLLQTLPKSIELDDLVSAGLFGLMDAIRGFDPTRGIKFKTYCTTRIRGSILDQLRSQDWVPRLVRLKAGRIEKMLHKLQGEYGREPTHAELAQALQMDHAELSQEMSQSHAKTMFSLSERWDDRDDDNPMEKVEIVEDQKAIDPIGELNRRDLMIFITKSLTHKERFIIEQYYQVGHTMREIGEMLALTESRVCQIHSNVMSRLKGLLSPKSNNLIT
jgi:RNA polymerase sigma factor for flagellar operon FliA